MGLFLEDAAPAFRPRVLELVLRGPAGVLVREGTWESPDALTRRLGGLSGAALALVDAFAAVERGDAPPALSVAVGSSVRRGLPTAARATVAGVAPLSGGWVEGQVGGGLAERLVARADLLTVRGERVAPSLLVVPEGEAPRLLPAADLTELDLTGRCELLRRRHPAASGLVVGPAAERGVRFASLATLEAPPSFTGRGGLGLRLAELGIVALLVEGPARSAEERGAVWSARLAASPTLRMRGSEGTFELFDAFAARGDAPADPSRRGALADTLARRESCPGCPTACRHVLATGRGELAARFSGTYPLGPPLGLEGAEAPLRLLAACNAVGVDAGEAGAVLAVVVDGLAPDLRGDADALEALLRSLGGGATRRELEPARLARGASALARELGRPDLDRGARGGSVRRVSDLAALLGQCVSARGVDPMRSFPFLAESGGDAARLARLVAPLELPEAAFDPHDPAGKGRLVWWHENLACALDAAGFCAFSAAGLLSDGQADLDDLAGWLALPGLAPGGEALLAAGASLVLVQRLLAERSGARPGDDLPAWAREALELPGMWDEYRALRGLDPEGRLTAAARAAVGTLRAGGVEGAGLGAVGERRTRPAPPRARRPGRLRVRAAGALGEVLGGELDHGAPLPDTVGGVLRALAAAHPAGASWLWRDGETAVSVWRDGRRLAPDELVADGDLLDLVVALGGG
jgi:aldehyde:ferredoxin oxidoreductase